MCEIYLGNSKASHECGTYVPLYTFATLLGGITAGLIAVGHARMTAWLTPAGESLSAENPDKLIFQSFAGSQMKDEKAACLLEDR